MSLSNSNLYCSNKVDAQEKSLEDVDEIMCGKNSYGEIDGKFYEEKHLQIFLSSICDTQYNRIRAKVEEEIKRSCRINFNVYRFEKNGASIISSRDLWKLALKNSEVCIFLIDISNITVPVKAELDLAVKEKKKILLYYIRSKNEELNSDNFLEKLLELDLATYKNVETFENIEKQIVNDLNNDIANLYLMQLVTNNRLEEVKSTCLPKAIMGDLPRTMEKILTFSSWVYCSSGEEKKSDIDEYCALFFDVIMGKSTIKSFNRFSYVEIALEYHLNYYEEILNWRWKAIEYFLLEKYDECLNALEQSKKIAYSSEACESWIKNNILLDIKNISVLKNKKLHLDNDCQVKWEDEELYFPGIDRLLSELNNIYLKEFKDKNLKYTTYLIKSNESQKCSKNLSAILSIAMFYGSLTYIFLFIRYMCDFQEYLNSINSTIGVKKTLIKLLTRENRDESIASLLSTDSLFRDNIDRKWILEVFEFCKTHHEKFNTLIAQICALKYWGYYLDDDNFRNIYSDLSKRVYSLWSSPQSFLYIAKNWFDCLNSIIKRISIEDRISFCTLYYRNKIYFCFDEFINFIDKNIPLDKLNKTNTMVMLNLLREVLSNSHNHELIRYNRSGFISIRNKYKELTHFFDDFMPRIITDKNEYNIYIRLTGNSKSDEILRDHLNALEADLSLEKSGKYFGILYSASNVFNLLQNYNSHVHWQDFSEELVNTMFSVISSEHKFNMEKVTAIAVILLLLKDKNLFAIEKTKSLMTIKENELDKHFNIDNSRILDIGRDAVVFGLFLLFYKIDSTYKTELLIFLSRIADISDAKPKILELLCLYFDYGNHDVLDKSLLESLFLFSARWVEDDREEVIIPSLILLILIGAKVEYRKSVYNIVLQTFKRGNSIVKKFLIDKLKSVQYWDNEEYSKLVDYCETNLSHEIRLLVQN